MSLINDALRKARETKPADAKPSADGPALRPVPVVHISGSWKISVTLLLALLSVVVLSLAIMFLAQWYAASSQDVKVRANTKPWQVTDITKPKVPPVVHVPNPALPAMAPSDPAGEKTAKTDSLLMISNSIGKAATNLASASDPLKVAEVKYKLQSIIYRPGDSLVLINGKTAGIGETVQGARIVDIQQESATIVTKDGTTILMELK